MGRGDLLLERSMSGVATASEMACEPPLGGRVPSELSESESWKGSWVVIIWTWRLRTRGAALEKVSDINYSLSTGAPITETICPTEQIS